LSAFYIFFFLIWFRLHELLEWVSDRGHCCDQQRSHTCGHNHSLRHNGCERGFNYCPKWFIRFIWVDVRSK
jgi:hypothetical protein